MNIAFFLLPKKDVVYLPLKCTMRQALEKMEYHRYTAVPLIDEDGKYAGTLTEGDLLWKLKNTPGLTFKDASKVPLTEVPRRVTNNPVRIDAQIEDLFTLAIVQNFVPVVDDHDIFIGIIRRREIIEYYGKMLLANAKEANTEKSFSPKYLFFNMVKGFRSEN
ncbi:MAG: CBS domain-containing protein [Firmicutes bacterium]|nr:CBS domain-containing protein [Bacillota bacterium]